MAQQVAGYAYWISALVKNSGLHVRSDIPREKRHLFRELARLLLKNDFDDLCQLSGSQDPSEWVDAETFTHDDLEIIREMQRGCAVS